MSTWPNLSRNLVAILRGVRPDEVARIADVLIDAGFEAIEIPLNSPDPFRSIETVVRMAPDSCLIGAGTVLTPDAATRLANIGGRLLVSPNIDAEVMDTARRHGLITMPGVFTATEALLALRLGASALKFFPANALGPAGIKGVGAILPPGTVIGAVGGVADDDFAAYRAAGVQCFGLGSSLYRAGLTPPEVATRAHAAIASYDALDG